MSISSVRSEIRKAMVADACDGSNISAAEMGKIVKKAESDGVVSAGEARQIRDLVEKGIVRDPSGVMTMACPEHHGSSFTIDKAAKSAGNAMFARNALPYGSNEAPMREKIAARLEDADLGPTIKKPSLRNMHHIQIRDQRMVDGPLVEAYVDPKKDRMFVKVTGAGMAGPHTVGPYWHGPISLESQQKDVTTATTKKLVKAAHEAMKDGVEFSAPSAPLGQRMVRVPLFAERHPDGYSYAALIPVGALAPGAPTSDPNKAKSFWLERTGGIAGMTSVGGPVSV